MLTPEFLSLQLQECTFAGTSTERVYVDAVRYVYRNALFDTNGSSFGEFAGCTVDNLIDFSLHRQTTTGTC